MKRRFLEECLAKGMSLEAIGREVGKHPATVGYWLKKHGLIARGAEKYARRGAIGRDELSSLVKTGATVAEMAERLDRSSSTVRYWLKRYGLTILGRRGSRPRRGEGARFATFECRRHGTTEFILEGRGYYRCKRCRAAAVAKRRRTVKRQLVDEAGGACALCGYQRWIGALQFHHLDPSQKEFHIGQRGYSRSLSRSRAEAQKCVLLCANCHAEVEGGFATLPVDSCTATDEAVV
jgi:DNA-binding transcriptional ArsR family regulator